MSHGFRRGFGGRVSVRLNADEADALRTLGEQLTELLADDASEDAGDDAGQDTDQGDALAAELGLSDLGRPGRTSAPDDPVLARLFPDAYSGDSEASGDFRRFTEGELRDDKRAVQAEMVAAIPVGGGTITLDPEQAGRWLRGLNDLRLALGVRLDVTEEAFGRLDQMSPDDPQYAALAAYDWLSYLLDTLVRAL